MLRSSRSSPRRFYNLTMLLSILIYVTSASPTIYFGYGSNLWLAQMQSRCPNSTYVGIARLNSYQWIINERGYANVVASTSSSTRSDPQKIMLDSTWNDEVWGMMYTLTPADEASLDRYEGVPVSYVKEELNVDFWEQSDGMELAGTNSALVQSTALVYINRKQVTPGPPKAEYIVRMNHGIADALQKGIPRAYVDTVMRPFIPDTDLKEGSSR